MTPDHRSAGTVDHLNEIVPAAQTPEGAPDLPLSQHPVNAYLASRGIAQLGGAMTETIIPIIVVVSLGGDAAAVGGALAATLVTSIACRVPLSAFVDRQERQVVLQVASQIIAAATACLVPLLWLTDLLSYPLLIVAIVFVVSAQALVETCGHATLNTISTVDQRVGVIGHLNSLASAAAITGQSVAPCLTRLMPAPLIVLVDAATNLVSAAVLWPVRSWERRPDADPPTDVAHVTYRAVLRETLGVSSVWTLWVACLINSVPAPVALLYVTQTLAIPVEVVGLLFATGAIGGIMGGLVVGRFVRRLSLRTVLLSSVALSLVSIALFVAAAAASALVYALVIGFEFLSALAGTVLVASVLGSVQVRSGPRTVARRITVASTGMEVLGLAGIGIGSLVATWFSPMTALLVAGAGYAALLVVSALVKGSL